MHFPPDEPVDQQPFVGAVQQMRFDFAVVFGFHGDAAGHGDQQLFQFTVRVETARHAGFGAENVINTLNVKRQVVSVFQRNQRPAVVAVNLETNQ